MPFDMRPEVVNLVSGNDTTVIPAEDANVGDILLIRPGDRSRWTVSSLKEKPSGYLSDHR